MKDYGRAGETVGKAILVTLAFVQFVDWIHLTASCMAYEALTLERRPCFVKKVQASGNS